MFCEQCGDELTKAEVEASKKSGYYLCIHCIEDLEPVVNPKDVEPEVHRYPTRLTFKIGEVANV